MITLRSLREAVTANCGSDMILSIVEIANTMNRPELCVSISVICLSLAIACSALLQEFLRVQK